MFITVDGFNKTGIPTALWDLMEPYAKIDQAKGTAVLAVVILVLSNVASNVPTGSIIILKTKHLMLPPQTTSDKILIPKEPYMTQFFLNQIVCSAFIGSKSGGISDGEGGGEEGVVVAGVGEHGGWKLDVAWFSSKPDSM